MSLCQTFFCQTYDFRKTGWRHGSGSLNKLKHILQLLSDYNRKLCFYNRGVRWAKRLAEKTCVTSHHLFVFAAGMSTVHEVIVARHAGMRCFALSLISNRAVMDYDSQEKANHEEVLETGRLRSGQLEKLVSTMVAQLEHNNNSY